MSLQNISILNFDDEKTEPGIRTRDPSFRVLLFYITRTSLQWCYSICIISDKDLLNLRLYKNLNLCVLHLSKHNNAHFYQRRLILISVQLILRLFLIFRTRKRQRVNWTEIKVNLCWWKRHKSILFYSRK